MPKAEKLANIINERESATPKEKKHVERTSPSETFVRELKEIVDEVIIIDYDFETNHVDRSKVKPFGQDETIKIDIAPVDFVVKKIVRPKYKDKNNIYQAIVKDVFPHSVLTPSLASNIISMKFELGIPFYRYHKYMEGRGIKIPLNNFYNYIKRVSDLLMPLYDKLLECLVNNNSNVIHCDETTLEVVDSPKDKCYMFVYTTSFWDNPIYIYEFNENRTTDKLKTHLKNYDGFIVCDGYSGYNCFDKVQRCFAHARRYFFDCIKILPSKQRSLNPAYHVVNKIDALFNLEASFKKKHLTASQIKQRRNEKEYLNKINDLNDYVDNIGYEKNTLLEKAVKYYLKFKEELFTYLKDGHIDISNNLAERVVKPFVIARKNFMFCKNENGAQTTGILFSIVQTARSSGVIVEEYLKYVMENIEHKQIDDLLPWSEKLPKELKISL